MDQKKKPIPALTPNEVHMAASHAILRRYEKLKGNRGDRPQKERSSWDNEIEGACCELAVCNWLKIPWLGAQDIRAVDAQRIEVKWTRHCDTGGLIVHTYMDPNEKYVLFDGFAPQYYFVGWAYGHEVMKDEYMQSWGAFLMPREKLHREKE